jgi:hypothetical protein
MLLAVDAPKVLGNATEPRLRFVEAEKSDPAWVGRRLLTVDNVPAFELSFWCGTCQFLFERLQGATTTFSLDDTDGLTAGPGGLDDRPIALLGPHHADQPATR